MMKKIIKFRRIALLAVVCIVILIPTSLGNSGVEAHLWVNDADDFPDTSSGYITSESEFTLYITNQDPDEGAEKLVLIISLPGYDSSDTTPVQSVNITQEGVTTTISGVGSNPYDNWTWGTPSTNKSEDCNKNYSMPPSGTFPTFFAYYDMGPIGSKDSVDNCTNASIEISGGPPVRFDAWGLNQSPCEFIVLKNPFSHLLKYVPEFPTIALPIAAIIGLMFILRSRNRKED